MPDMLATGASWLAGQLQEHVSQTVTYSRAGKSPITVLATIGGGNLEQLDEAGQLIAHADKDFLIRPEDLVIGGTAVEPARGDQVTWNGRTYEAMDLDGQPCFDVDAHRSRFRIHTKQVE